MYLFNIDPEKGTKCMVLERVRGNKEYPFVSFISYFNPSIPLTGDEDFTQPLYGILENKYDIIVKPVKRKYPHGWPENISQKNWTSNPATLY